MSPARALFEYSMQDGACCSSAVIVNGTYLQFHLHVMFRFRLKQRTSSQCIQRRCIHSTVDCQSIVQTECQSSRQAASTWHRVKMGPMSRGTDAASWLRDIQRADGHLLMSGPCRAIPHCCNRLRAKEVAEVLCGCCQICPGFNLGSKPSRCGTRLKASNQAWKRERSAKEQGSNKRFTQFNIIYIMRSQG